MSRERYDRQGFTRWQLISEFGMALIYITLGVAVLATGHFGSFEAKGIWAWAFCGLLIVYGAFRLYRGFGMLKQNRED